MTRGDGPRVIIADDNQLVRMGLRLFFEEASDIVLVAEARDGVEAVQLCRQHKPDVLVVDLTMPGLDGIAVLRQVIGDGLPTNVLVLSHHDTDEHVFQALRSGATGYVTKDMPPEKIVEAIRAVSKGQVFVPQEVASKLAQYTRFEPLTSRERQVLQKLGEGLSNREVGKALGIAERTVAAHMQSLLNKLDASTRLEAVSVARRRGLID